MTADDVVRQLARLTKVLLESGVAVDYNSPTKDPPMGNKVTVAWGTQGDYPPLAAMSFGSIEEYQYYVKARNYTFLLFDGALLQISYKFYRDELKGHRLCYYPCPFKLDPDLFPDLPLEDCLEDIVAKILRENNALSTGVQLRSPVRIDYDPENGAEGHPSCHLHLNSQNCRLGVSIPLSVGHFIRFVFSNFYPEKWDTCEDLKSWPSTYQPRLQTAWEEHNAFIDFARPA